jgi:hypothetical protein
MSVLMKVSNSEYMDGFGDEFVCPCKPWKKMAYGVFVRHIIKRHDGKTPKFYMKLPSK